MGQAISSTQFYVYGRRHFTRTGYEKHIKAYTSPVQNAAHLRPGQADADDVTMDGKVVVITGANSGLGKELATYAAAKGADLYMVCRSKDRAEKARQEILDLTKLEEASKVKIVLADLSEMAQVRQMVAELQSQTDRVDCLICNAGVLLNERAESSEGNEATFASHLLGAYLMTQLLLPQLKKADGRCLFVSSAGMLNTKWPDWPTATSQKEGAKHKYDGQFAYAYAKRGQILLTERLAEEQPDVMWVAGHPGWSATPAVDDAYGDNKKYLEPMRTPWQGAEGLSWVMSCPKTELKGGAFYLDRTTQPKHIAGPFMTEGSFTKNTKAEVDEFMAKLKETAGL